MTQFKPTEELIEKTAKAIWNSESIRARGVDRSIPWSQVAETDKVKYRHSATYALEEVKGNHNDKE